MKKPTKEQLMEDVLSDLSWQQIAEKYGYTDSRFLRKWAKIWDLPPRRKFIKPSKEQLVDLIFNQKLNINQIAQSLGYSEGGWSNVYAYCREYGIEFDLRPNAELREIPFTKEQQSIIIGTLLGDGYLRPNRSGTCCLVMGHGEKQYDYLLWKKEKFGHFIISDKPYHAKKESVHNHAPFFTINTVTHPYLTELRTKFYPNEIKTISEEWLKQVDELALAVWFMDDGSLNKRYGTMTFCTNGFTYNEHILMKDWFQDRWGLSTAIDHIKSRNQFNIRLHRSSSRRLREIISPYVPSSMKYKVVFKH
ncbi:hypothetical protein [Peribacillus acanthi]|uniref:hypothetical protein n=1 Tax=Peribacillus acanthi TaxID=2171554 RepID=UPI000D3E4968|nr:hypothetical protein [Peribacillus acanthi]